MQEFPGNSQMPLSEPKGAPKEKKVDKVVTGNVARRKRPFGKRFAETFVGGDAKGVVGYVLMDVLVPAARDAVSDAVSTGIDRLLYGESRSGRRHSSRGGTGSYVSYNRFATSGGRSRSEREEPRRENRTRRNSHDIDDIILATRVEADEVIDRLFDLVQTYDVATVADLYQMVGITHNYIDQKWGWTDIRGAGVTKTRAGYLLDIPQPESID